MQLPCCWDLGLIISMLGATRWLETGAEYQNTLGHFHVKCTQGNRRLDSDNGKDAKFSSLYFEMMTKQVDCGSAAMKVILDFQKERINERHLWTIVGVF